MENGDKIIRTKDILHVYERILNGNMSLNEADLWASRLKRLHDDSMIELEVECPSRDWDALLYLVGVDMQTAPGVYLHTIQDIEAALFRFFPEYFINRTNKA